MLIEQATTDDAKELHLAYREIQQQERTTEDGFLLADFSVDDIINTIQNPAFAWYIAKQDGKIVGFMLLSSVLGERGESCDFTMIEPLGEVSELMMIDRVGVLAGYRRKGIASQLYEEAYAKQVATFASVVVAPWFNGASVSFHMRSGFRVVGYGIHGDIALLLFRRF